MKTGAPEHPKMKKLARKLGINRAHAIGIMEGLWHWAGKFCPQGNIGKYDDEDIAEGCFWEEKTSTLMEALVETGWVDKDLTHRLILHDWEDHCEEYVRKKLSRNNLHFVETLSRQCPDNVEMVSVKSAFYAARHGLACIKGKGSGEGEESSVTFEQAMERVDVQLRGEVAMDFARMVFDSWDQREGRDGAGIKVRFEKHLRKRWNQEGEQWKNGQHSIQKGKAKPVKNPNPTNYINPP